MAPPLREMLTSTEPEHCNDRVYRQTQHWGILPHKSHHLLFNVIFLQLILLQVHFQLIFLIFKTNGCVLFYLIKIIIKSMLMGNIIIVGGFFKCFMYTPICEPNAACMSDCMCLFVPHWCPHWLRCHQWIDFQFPFTEKGGYLSCG